MTETPEDEAHLDLQTPPTEDALEAALDDALTHSFPASDPVAHFRFD